MPEQENISTLTKNKKTQQMFEDIKPEFYFKLIDGSEIKNLLEFADALEKMSDDAFYYHANEQKNDFSNWIRDIFKEKDLADNIKKSNSKAEAEISILKFLVNKLR